jgi:hypothetical protein
MLERFDGNAGFTQPRLITQQTALDLLNPVYGLSLVVS